VLPFAMPSTFRAEAWQKKIDIDTPKWQQVDGTTKPAPRISSAPPVSSRGRQIKYKPGCQPMQHDSDSEGEEDTSAEAYFLRHSRCSWEAKCELAVWFKQKKGGGGGGGSNGKGNGKGNGKVKGKEAGKDGKDRKTSRKAGALKGFDETKPFACPPAPLEGLETYEFNYPSCSRPWKKPKNYITLNWPILEAEGEAEGRDAKVAKKEEVEEVEEENSNKRRRKVTERARESNAQKLPSKQTSKNSKNSKKRPAAAQAQQRRVSLRTLPVNQSDKCLTPEMPALASGKSHQFAMLKLRYLHLRKHLAVLQQEQEVKRQT